MAGRVDHRLAARLALRAALARIVAEHRYVAAADDDEVQARLDDWLTGETETDSAQYEHKGLHYDR